MTVNVDDVCDYIIVKLAEANADLNMLKLQKLIYYVQAWHLAFFDKPLFLGRFQAWVHGPVNRQLYDRFKDSKSLYSQAYLTDIRPDFDLEGMPLEARRHIDAVLEGYAEYSGSQLEEMTHAEEPWKAARQGVRPSERCEKLIDQKLMKEYYKARLH